MPKIDSNQMTTTGANKTPTLWVPLCCKANSPTNMTQQINRTAPMDCILYPDQDQNNNQGNRLIGLTIIRTFKSEDSSPTTVDNIYIPEDNLA